MNTYTQRKIELQRLTAAKQSLLDGHKEMAERALNISGLTHQQCLIGINARLRNAIAQVQCGRRMPASIYTAACAAFKVDTTDKPVKAKVLAVSSNSNSFGLRGVVVLFEDGKAYELGMHCPPALGTTYDCRLTRPWLPGIERYVLSLPSFEIPKSLPAVPAEVMKEAFGS